MRARTRKRTRTETINGNERARVKRIHINILYILFYTIRRIVDVVRNVYRNNYIHTDTVPRRTYKQTRNRSSYKYINRIATKKKNDQKKCIWGDAHIQHTNFILKSFATPRICRQKFHKLLWTARCPTTIIKPCARGHQRNLGITNALSQPFCGAFKYVKIIVGTEWDYDLISPQNTSFLSMNIICIVCRPTHELHQIWFGSDFKMTTVYVNDKKEPSLVLL